MKTKTGKSGTLNPLLIFLLALPLLFSSHHAKAQVFPPAPYSAVSPYQTFIFPDFNQIRQTRLSHQKWFTSTYAGVSVGFYAYPGGTASYFSTPLSWQLNRQLSKNLYAFGGVYVAPTYAHFGARFMNPTTNGYFPNQPFIASPFSLNPGIQMGLMYINDSGTFSISGSIRAESHTYPFMPAPPPSPIKK